MTWNLYSYLETGLTVGVISGLISGVTATLSFLFPLLAIYFMLHHVQKHDFDTATWTAISGLIQGSSWPAVLFQGPGNFDITKWPPWQRRIDGKIFFFSTVLPICWLMFLLASYLTPQALRVEQVVASHTSDVAFEHVPDLSFYGIGSQNAPINAFQRLCGWNVSLPCPGQTPYSSTKKMLNSTLPANITTLFTSAVINTTIASPLDIKYRHWYKRNFSDTDNGAWKAVGSYQPMTSILLDDDFVLVEGLIIDAINGGVGFRNHTMPHKMALGAQWTEDILFIDPVTECLDSNLTFHYSLSSTSVDSKTAGFIQDDGGFSNLPSQEPQPAWSGNSNKWRQSGPRPDLAGMAYHAAYWTNQLTAQVMGINSSTLGQQYTQQLNSSLSQRDSLAVTITPIDGDYLDDVNNGKSSLGQSFTNVGTKCTGYADDDYTTDSMAMVMCGQLFSASQPDGNNSRQDLSSKWHQKLYTCASGLKASVKTVTFRYDGSTNLTSLEVVSATPKAYSSPPTWAIEKRSSQFAVQDIDLLYGIVDSKTQESADVSVYHTEDIFLPAGTRGRRMGIRQVDVNAAARAFSDAWHAVYKNAAAVALTGMQGIPNYGGGNDYALTAKWRDLSTDAAGAARILNLIWTDLAASTVSGAKHGFESSTGTGVDGVSFAHADTLGTRVVHRIIAWPVYDNWGYAVPIFVATLMFLVFGLLPAAAVALTCTVKISTMKHYINQTFMPRPVTQIVLRDDAHPTQSGEEWLDAVGSRAFDVARPGQYNIVNHMGTPMVSQSAFTPVSTPGLSEPPRMGAGPLDHSYDCMRR